MNIRHHLRDPHPRTVGGSTGCDAPSKMEVFNPTLNKTSALTHKLEIRSVNGSTVGSIHSSLKKVDLGTLWGPSQGSLWLVLGE